METADWSERSIRSRPNERTNRSASCGRRDSLELGKKDGNGGQSKTEKRDEGVQCCA